MDKKVTLICGQPFSGLSAMMRALDAGGFPVVGGRPNYRPEGAVWSISSAYAGMALRLGDPREISIPKGEYRAIYLTRNATDQARLQIEQEQGQINLKSSETQALIRARSKLIHHQDKEAMTTLVLVGANPIIIVNFDRLTANPVEELEKLATQLGDPVFAANIMVAAGVILPTGRDPAR